MVARTARLAPDFRGAPAAARAADRSEGVRLAMCRGDEEDGLSAAARIEVGPEPTARPTGSSGGAGLAGANWLSGPARVAARRRREAARAARAARRAA